MKKFLVLISCTVSLAVIACSVTTGVNLKNKDADAGDDGTVYYGDDSGTINSEDNDSGVKTYSDAGKHDSGTKPDSGSQTCPNGDVVCGKSCMPNMSGNICCASVGINGYCGNNQQCNSDGTCGSCDKACWQEESDYNTAITVTNLTLDLWNAYIANQTWTGSVNGTCPLGGTAAVSGTITTVPYQVAPNVTEGTVTTVNLQFTFASCQVLDQGDNLFVTGTMNESGYWNTGTGTDIQVLSYQSDSISINGVLSGDAGINDNMCVVIVTDNSQANPEFSGKICNRVF